MVIVGQRVPPNLSIFVAAVFLSNSVNIFTNIYSGTSLPPRFVPLLISCVTSLISAALWTMFASKAELIEKTAGLAAQDLVQRDSVRATLWNDVWIQVAIYLGFALGTSMLALVALVVPVQ